MLKFPKDFLFGTATSSYQIEGAWDEDGKGENIWDRLCHAQSESIRDGENGDVACDSYHLYKEDIKMLKELGVHFYRFSISWARVLPSGYTDHVNEAGIEYYNKIINELLDNGIQPMVTMFHWDLPQPLQDLGGWTNRVIVDSFEDYARILFLRFGDRVKWWFTINEPTTIAIGYSFPLGMAPNVPTPGRGDYLVIHHILLAHARAFRLYDKEFRQEQKGKVSLANLSNWIEPKTESAEDVAAAERTRQMSIGWVLHPIFSTTGDYPPVMRRWMDNKSKSEGHSRSRLPVFSQQEVDMIRGSWDFLALNHYTTFFVSEGLTGFTLFKDAEVTMSQDEELQTGASIWLQVAPAGFRKVINWICKEYGNPPVLITENGYSDHGELDDMDRINYYTEYLKSMLVAMHEDGCNVIGYTAWSLMDNFEWAAGYIEKFGLYHVDFSDPQRKRTPKQSAKFYKELIAKNQIPACNCKL